MKDKVSPAELEGKYGILYVSVVLVSLLPVSCAYIISGGLINDWIVSVEDMAADIMSVSLDVGFWYIVPVLFRKLFGNITAAYRIWMVCIQIVTMVFAKMLFDTVFEKEGDRLSVFFGVLLYMTCPYRIYVCYDLADISHALIWMLLPLYIRAVWNILERKNVVSGILTGALVLAGMGYANAVFFVIVFGLTLIAAVITCNIYLLSVLPAAMLVFGPGLFRLAGWLFGDGIALADIPIRSIMENGYRIGEFFSSYTWRDGHPGIGMGILLCLAAGIWLGFVQGDLKRSTTANRGLSVIALVLSIFSLRYFPWDVGQRLGDWSLKFISLMKTPAIFWELACVIFCILGAGYLERIRKDKTNKIGVVLPIIVLLFCVGGCVYQCNTLVFERPGIGMENFELE